MVIAYVMVEFGFALFQAHVFFVTARDA